MWLANFFWVSAMVIFFAYVGYPVLLFLLSFLKKKQSTAPLQQLPSITLIIAAYNEEQVIAEKLQNTFAQDYPPEQMQVIVVADGSTDQTAAIASSFKNVQLLHETHRKGKASAINRAFAFATNEMIVLTDANSFLQTGSLQQLVKPFADIETGAVAGEKKVFDGNNGSVSGEGMYWKYESWLKQQETIFYTVIGAAGELFAIRKELFVQLPEHAITDDFFLSLSVNLQHKKCAYAKEAVSTETASLTLADEWKRKVRIAAGGVQSLFLVSAALNPFKNPTLAFQFFSHRVLRWIFCAPAFILLFVSNLFLVINHAGMLYDLLLLLQTLFYVFAIIGCLINIIQKPFFLFGIPFYLVFMHAAMLAGIWQFVTGKQSVLWQKAKR